MHSYIPLEPKLYFGAPYKHIHMDRHRDANDTIYAFLTWSDNLPYPNILALTHIIKSKAEPAKME